MNTRKLLIAGGFAALCVPMLLVGFLLASIRLPRLDSTTLRMPAGWRSAVAAAIQQQAGVGGPRAKLTAQRILRLDPDNGEAWDTLCDPNADPFNAEEQGKACRLAEHYLSTASTAYYQGRALERADDLCGAEEAYTKASQRAPSGNTEYLSAVGRTAFGCGHFPDARAALSAALEFGEKDLKDMDDDGDERETLQSTLADDRKLLAEADAQMSRHGHGRASAKDSGSARER